MPLANVFMLSIAPTERTHERIGNFNLATRSVVIKCAVEQVSNNARHVTNLPLESLTRICALNINSDCKVRAVKL